ncbi:MAG: TolC family protein [Cytophagaceae bacterium]|nr:TolC family protein [Cytophagaceae bacterium]
MNNSLIDNALKEELTIKDHKKPTLNAGVYNQSMLGSLRQFVGVLGVEIPIFVKAYNARQQSAKLRVEMAEQQRDKFDFQMQTELNALQNQLEIIEKQLNSIRNSSLPDAEKSLSILLNKYKEGQTEYTDWYIVFGQYLGYKNNLIDLEKEKNITVSKIYYISENE